MYITNITDDYNDTLPININCTNNDKNIEIIITLFTIIPCGMSLICLISLMIYVLFKPLLTNTRYLKLHNVSKYYHHLQTHHC